MMRSHCAEGVDAKRQFPKDGVRRVVSANGILQISSISSIKCRKNIFFTNSGA